MLLDGSWIMIFLLLGAFVGFMAGMLGVGGAGLWCLCLLPYFCIRGFLQKM